jgi:hypothetical protein
MMSRRQLARMAERIRAWQDRIAAVARDVDLDVVRLAPNPESFDLALAEFVAERRLRRK